MRTQHVLPVALWLVVVVAMTAPGFGCGSGSNADTTGSTSRGDSTSSTGSTNAAGTGGGGGGAGGDVGQGGSGQGGDGGGQGGGIHADYGPPATELVSAGEVSESSNYTMVFTLGQPSQSQGTAKSTSYRLQGGLVGANGSLP